ncbi:MAG: terminase small subunit [Oscillospiraceae bacterium]|nr:terminase small subunit [Oscillospiraceae bacterium]
MRGKPGRPKGERKSLSDREMKFVQCFARTGNKSLAYREAGYSVGNMHSTQIASNANRIYRRPLVQEEINRIKAAEEEVRMDAYKAEMTQQLSQWSRDDSLDALKVVVQDALRAMRKPILDSEGNEIGYSFDPAAARVVRDAVESLNKMQGYNEPEKSEVDAVINVAFADGGDFAG